MVSTVEHLWLYRLLYQFEQQKIYSNWIVLVIDRFRYLATRRWPVSALAAALACGLAVATAVTTGRLQLALGAVAAFVTAVAGAAIAAVVLQWIGGWN